MTVAPVVSGRTCRRTFDIVFEDYERFNPSTELEIARNLRDQVIRRYMVRSEAFSTGGPNGTKHHAAQAALKTALAARGWNEREIARYLGLNLHRRAA